MTASIRLSSILLKGDCKIQTSQLSYICAKSLYNTLVKIFNGLSLQHTAIKICYFISGRCLLIHNGETLKQSRTSSHSLCFYRIVLPVPGLSSNARYENYQSATLTALHGIFIIWELSPCPVGKLPVSTTFHWHQLPNQLCMGFSLYGNYHHIKKKS